MLSPQKASINFQRPAHDISRAEASVESRRCVLSFKAAEKQAGSASMESYRLTKRRSRLANSGVAAATTLNPAAAYS